MAKKPKNHLVWPPSYMVEDTESQWRKKNGFTSAFKTGFCSLLFQEAVLKGSALPLGCGLPESRVEPTLSLSPVAHMGLSTVNTHHGSVEWLTIDQRHSWGQGREISLAQLFRAQEPDTNLTAEMIMPR